LLFGSCVLHGPAGVRGKIAHSGLLLYAEDAGAHFLETSDRYQSIDIANDSFRMLAIACGPGLHEATVFVTGIVGEDAAATNADFASALYSVFNFSHSTESV
jgi:hypothetical protein